MLIADVRQCSGLTRYVYAALEGRLMIPEMRLPAGGGLWSTWGGGNGEGTGQGEEREAMVGSGCANMAPVSRLTVFVFCFFVFLSRDSEETELHFTL